MKTWETPKLIVLVRNNPQEAVLSLCKSGVGALIAAANPSAYDLSCTYPPATANGAVCTDCNTVALS